MPQDKVTHSQSSPPSSVAGRLKRDPDRHYALVQTDAANLDYTSPLYDLMDQSSPTDPTQAMYREESVSPRDTGSSKMTLISCSKADIDAYLKENDREARFRENAVVSTDNEDESISRIRQSISA